MAPVAGYVGADVPVELLTAAGYLPRRLSGSPDDDAETGDVDVDVDAEVELDGERDTPEDVDIEAELGRTREGGRDDSLRHGIVVQGGVDS